MQISFWFRSLGFFVMDWCVQRCVLFDIFELDRANRSDPRFSCVDVFMCMFVGHVQAPKGACNDINKMDVFLCDLLGWNRAFIFHVRFKGLVFLCRLELHLQATMGACNNTLKGGNFSK
jgi:hypothetical protein